MTNSKINAIALFCDDSREEQARTETLVGIYSDHLRVHSFPSTFPRMVIYIRVHIPVDLQLTKLVYQIRENGAVAFESGFDLNEIAKFQKEARYQNIKYAGAISRVISTPFIFDKEKIIEVYILHDDNEFVAGSLSVRDTILPTA